MKTRVRIALVMCVPLWVASLAAPAVAHPHRAEADDRPWLGVAATNMDFTRLETLELQYGVEVTHVAPGSPADDAGIRPQDILVELDGKPLYSMRRLRWLVGRARVGEEVTLKYVREKHRETTKVRIDARSKAIPPRGHHLPFRLLRPDSYLGVSLQNMGDDLRRSFGAPEDSGVLIAEVSADSPASEAGLAAGDVIVKMDRKHVRYIADVYRVLDYFDPGEQVAVEIIRDKRAQTITVTLGARPEGQTLGHSWEKAEEHLRYFLDPESWRDEFEGLLERWSRRHRWREQSAPPTHQEAL